MTITRNQITTGKFNEAAKLPYELRLEDFKLAIQDVYDFFHDVNRALVGRGLDRLDDMLRPAIMSGLLSDMLTSSLGSSCDRYCSPPSEESTVLQSQSTRDRARFQGRMGFHY